MKLQLRRLYRRYLTQLIDLPVELRLKIVSYLAESVFVPQYRYRNNYRTENSEQIKRVYYTRKQYIPGESRTAAWRHVLGWGFRQTQPTCRTLTPAMYESCWLRLKKCLSGRKFRFTERMYSTRNGPSLVEPLDSTRYVQYIYY